LAPKKAKNHPKNDEKHSEWRKYQFSNASVKSDSIKEINYCFVNGKEESWQNLGDRFKERLSSWI